MKNSDKIIVAFLVSVGVFSTIQAKQYVGSISLKDKKVVLSVAKAATGKQILLCSGITNLSASDTNSKKKS